VTSNTIFNAQGMSPWVGDALLFASVELSLSSQEGQGMVNILCLLLTGQLWVQEYNAFTVDSLKAIAACCLRTEEMKLGLNFIFMINMIQFVTKIERLANFNLLICIDFSNKDLVAQVLPLDCLQYSRSFKKSLRQPAHYMAINYQNCRDGAQPVQNLFL
jgi:hypothetical protein